LRTKVDGCSSASDEGEQEQLKASSVFMSAGAGASVASRAKGADSFYAGGTPHRGGALVSDQQQRPQLKVDQQLVAKEVDLAPGRMPRPKLNQDSQLASNSARDQDSSRE
jgi:hypothetical protein